MRKTVTKIVLAIVGLALPGCGYTFSNNASPGLSINPFNWSSDRPVVSSSNDWRFMNGEPMDYRTKH
jgi:hypothetical protein